VVSRDIDDKRNTNVLKSFRGNARRR